MKSFILTIASLVLFAGICFGQIHEAGNKAVQFSAQHFFSDVSVGNVAGGVGARYFLFKGTSLQASYGSTLSNTSAPITALSGAILFDLGSTKNTAVSLGATVFYTHANEVDMYSLGGVILGEYFLADNLSLSASYPITVNHESSTNTTVWTIGSVSSSITVSLFF